MAELNVQPKKKKPVLPWLLLLLGVIALVWFLSRNREGAAEGRIDTDTSASTTGPTTLESTPVDTPKNISSSTANNDWNLVDFNAPVVKYDEITDQNINVRGDSGYSIYSIGESVLFDEGKANLRANAKSNLNQIKTSIDQRYKGGQIRVYGFTDADGSSEINKELAQRRANAVKDWLRTNGIAAKRISVHAFGEARPAATNNTEAGRQQNRRVEIVARVAVEPKKN